MHDDPSDKVPPTEKELEGQERRMGIEEQLWDALLTRAAFTDKDKEPLLAMARKRDLDIRRIMRGIDQVKNLVKGVGDTLNAKNRRKR